MSNDHGFVLPGRPQPRNLNIIPYLDIKILVVKITIVGMNGNGPLLRLNPKVNTLG